MRNIVSRPGGFVVDDDAPRARGRSTAVMCVGGGARRLPPGRLLLVALLLSGVPASARIGRVRHGAGGATAQRSTGRERGTVHGRICAFLVLIPCAEASDARHVLRLRGGFDAGRPLDDGEDDRGVGYDPEGFAEGDDVGASDRSVRDLDDGMDDLGNSPGESSRGWASENVDDASGAIPSGAWSEANDDSPPPASNPDDGADDLAAGSAAQHRAGDGRPKENIIKYHSSSDAEDEELRWLGKVDELVAKDDAQLVEGMLANHALKEKAEALAEEKLRAWQAPLSSHRSQVEHDRRERQALREQVTSKMGWHERLLQDEMRRANRQLRAPPAIGMGKEQGKEPPREEAGSGGPAEAPSARGPEPDLREQGPSRRRLPGAEGTLGAGGKGTGQEGEDEACGRSSRQRGERKDAGAVRAGHAGFLCRGFVVCRVFL